MEEKKEITPIVRLLAVAMVAQELGVTDLCPYNKGIFVVKREDFDAIIGERPVQTRERDSESYPTEYFAEIGQGWRVYTLDDKK